MRAPPCAASFLPFSLNFDKFIFNAIAAQGRVVVFAHASVLVPIRDARMLITSVR